MDHLNKAARSANMRRIKSRDTGPEHAVRRVAHRLGYRFRLHRRDLPGSPDLIFPKYRLAVFVHGCFWHRHDCKNSVVPKSRSEFWIEKFKRNCERDRLAERELIALGWQVSTIWECETRSEEKIAAILTLAMRNASGAH